jgi:ADP-heptose:LPS heptosyltransferase
MLLAQSTSKCSLVYHAGGIGDFITAITAFAAWNSLHPDYTRIFLGSPVTGAFGVDQGLFDEAWDATRVEFFPLYASDTRLTDALESKLSRVAAAFLFCDVDSPLRFRFEDRRLEKILVHPPFPTQRMHICDYHLSCLKDLVRPRSENPRLFPQQTGAAESKALIGNHRKIAVIHPGSGSAKKNWPRDCFETLARLLADRLFDVVWVTGPTEHGIVPESVRRTAICDTSLSTLVHVCSSSMLYVGNDSGISHLAAATGVPSVVLFGPSDPTVWQPRGPNVTILAAQEDTCFPCHPHGRTECGDSCITTIHVSRVFDACMTAIGLH